MQFAVALIEYLISGIAASAWLTVILKNYYPLPLSEINNYKEIFILAILPTSYVLGIYVDTTSSFFIRRTGELFKPIGHLISRYPSIRKAISSVWRVFAGTPKTDSYRKSAAILARSAPDAVRTMEAYVSRERIARGAAFNALAGAITATFYAPAEHKIVIVVVCCIAFAYSLIMHRRLQRLSSRFKEVVLTNLEQSTPTESCKIKTTTQADV